MTDSNSQASSSAPSIPGDALPPVEQHAVQYATVRNAHETELIEDYVELIGDLLKHRGEARAADIANRMAVSQATVSKMIRRLNELELVTSKPYRSLFLTEAGQKWRKHPVPATILCCISCVRLALRTPRRALTQKVWSTT